MTEFLAYPRILKEIYAPAFFQKLASSYSIVPQNPQEVRYLIEMARAVRAIQEKMQQANQQQQSQSIKEAAWVLQSLLNNE
ncbi:MAG: hypothetical protein KatS3mg035_1790 [Bacteroidia bacterium]|nr:MAG: hypothetical protein KatS3mg035_1790 [Bacteroidia bacterium]